MELVDPFGRPAVVGVLLGFLLEDPFQLRERHRPATALDLLFGLPTDRRRAVIRGTDPVVQHLVGFGPRLPGVLLPGVGPGDVQGAGGFVAGDVQGVGLTDVQPILEIVGDLTQRPAAGAGHVALQDLFDDLVGVGLLGGLILAPDGVPAVDHVADQLPDRLGDRPQGGPQRRRFLQVQAGLILV
jgi:hypothetical protein